VAVAGGLYFGIAASGAGAAADNRITTDVMAFIDGNNTVGTDITATSVSLRALDLSQIQADTAAASVAAAFGTVGAALSIGVSLASNSVDNRVEAFIADADVTASSGAITVKATEDASINALSVAASVAVGGGIVGVAISGAGAVADNTILGGAKAYAVDSSLDAATDVTFTAANTSDIEAKIVAASASVAVGGGGLGVSIGVSVARNRIGGTLTDGANAPLAVHAYAQDTSIIAGGDLSLTAKGEQTVDALVLAISAAVAGGGVGIAGSGAGVYAENRIATDVKAYIDGDRDGGVSARSHHASRRGLIKHFRIGRRRVDRRGLRRRRSVFSVRWRGHRQQRGQQQRCRLRARRRPHDDHGRH
jgi:hypothetical protein